MEKWNDNWIEELELIDYECYIRLCDCANIEKDILFMAKLMFKYNSNKGPEACLDRIIDWVTDWNNQFELFDYVTNEYIRLFNRLEDQYVY